MCQALITLPGTEAGFISTAFYFYFKNITISKLQMSKLRFRDFIACLKSKLASDRPGTSVIWKPVGVNCQTMIQTTELYLK